jgi:dCTP deaminase
VLELDEALEEPGMSIKSDRWIRRMSAEHGLIYPFSERVTSVGTGINCRKVISYGLSSYGYDIRVGNNFKVFTNVFTAVVDPKEFDARAFVDFSVADGYKCTIPPNSFALAQSVEKFKIPRNVLALCIGKSTFARCGIIVNCTPFEPEYEGIITLEISNTTPLPAVIYAGEGLAQVLFFESDEECETSYADRAGKYQGQTGLTLPKV